MKRYFSLSATALAVMVAAPAVLAISATVVPLASTAQLKTAQTEARWTVELPYPVVKVLAAADGTAIALAYTLTYGHGLQAKPGKYVLSLTARTQAGDETKREYPLEIDDYRY